MRDYTDFPSLSGIYLEDSYVIDILESRSEVQFVLEAVLTPVHPCYRAPASGEKHAYLCGDLVFCDVQGVEWLDRSFQRYVDATGAKDLGNIDSLASRDGVYSVIGDWGSVRIRSNVDPEFIARVDA
ncbi:hypothetical protein [Nocardia brasiliensis]|uniref:Uncharacterized protein n=1 Tax=Nocardia brasiliensis (strain ATCC 700358 / HUJEG-1) TaxID=1133849 RepID=K0ET83_NOCB7|nr:hypothetical protein [Nocardia brasiliensis]AFT98855.1 hypothetical protein O3I_004465 [Nocardia brasiliensis ATCC 700358]OCF84604.1 hypothetical protein AW168_40645 [Nocardia brasiliensis]